MSADAKRAQTRALPPQPGERTRDFIIEMYENCARDLAIACDFTERGDDCGANYAARKAIAYLRAGRGAQKLLFVASRQDRN